MTKPIIVVKICYKLLYVIQVISNFLASTHIKAFGRCNAASDWSHTFLHPGCFYLVFNGGRITNCVMCVSGCFGDVKAEGASLSTPSFIIFSPFYKLNEEKEDSEG